MVEMSKGSWVFSNRDENDKGFCCLGNSSGCEGGCGGVARIEGLQNHLWVLKCGLCGFSVGG